MKKYLFIIALLFITSPVFASDIVNHSGLSTSLEGCWSMDEAVTGTRVDSSTNGNDLDDINTVQPGTAHLGANAADFERATSERLTHADNASLSITGDMSFNAWVNVESSADSQTLWAKDDNSASNLESWRAEIHDISNQGQMTASDDGAAGGTAVLTISGGWPAPGTYYMVTYVYDASVPDLTIYINGSSNVSGGGTLPISIDDNTAIFTLGAIRDGATPLNFFDGLMDEAGLWSKELTSTEVTTLYNTGTGLACGTITVAVPDEPPQSEIFFQTSYWMDKIKEVKMV